MSSLGALSSKFSLASGCINDIVHLYISTQNDQSFFLQGPTNTANCMPPSYTPSLGAFYSGTVCPDHYTPACFSSTTSGQETDVVLTCCPSFIQFTCASATTDFQNPWQSTLGCVQTLTENPLTSATHLGPKGSSAVSTEFTTFPSTFGDGTIHAYSVVVRATATGGIASSTGKSGNGGGGRGEGLSAGAAAGIAIAAATLVVLMALGVFLFIRRRRRMAKGAGGIGGTAAEKTALAPEGGEMYAKPELPADASSAVAHLPSEMAVPTPGGHGLPAELPDDQVVAELPGRRLTP